MIRQGCGLPAGIPCVDLPPEELEAAQRLGWACPSGPARVALVGTDGLFPWAEISPLGARVFESAWPGTAEEYLATFWRVGVRSATAAARVLATCGARLRIVLIGVTVARAFRVEPYNLDGLKVQVLGDGTRVVAAAGPDEYARPVTRMDLRRALQWGAAARREGWE